MRKRSIFIALFKESILFAVHSLVVNKLRTVLSLLGITIGIFSIITVFTIVDSLEGSIRKSVSSLGDNVVFVQKWPWTFGPNYPWWKYMNRPLPRVYELDFIERKSKAAEAATLLVSGRRTIQYQSSNLQGAEIKGVSADYDKVKTLDIEEGRYFSDVESAVGKNAAIIGAKVAEALFPTGNALGKRIKVGGSEVIIIGVFRKQGEGINLFGSSDTEVLLPLNYVRNLIDINSDNIDPTIMVKAKPGITNDELIGELSGIMRSVRKLSPKEEDDFALNQTSLISTQFDGLFMILGTAGWIIGLFSILVGGFGIANIMFVSVRERITMIGIQKSLGAKNYFILLQFLSEAIFLSVIGGILGLLIIYAGTFFAEDWFGMEVTLSLSNVVLGLTVSALIGIISGFIPSYSASQLDPVEAMRSNG